MTTPTTTDAPGHLPGEPVVREWELSPTDEVLFRAEEAVRRRREAELDELLACLTWCDRFASDPRDEPGYVATPGEVLGGEKLVAIAGDGAPLVRDLSLLELGVALSRHPVGVRAMAADALDLRHRLPRTWRHVMDGQAEAWVARKVASISRAVPEAGMPVVDAAVAEAIIGVSPSRVLEIAEASVILADPDGHRARAAASRAKRYVGLGRADATGMRTLIARLATGDAVYVAAMVDRVADILTVQRAAAGLPEQTRDWLRAEAMGWLARPAELMALLVAHGADPADPATVGEEDNPHPVDEDWITQERRAEATRRGGPAPETEPDQGPEHDTVVPADVPDPEPGDEMPNEPSDHVEPEPESAVPASPLALTDDVLAKLDAKALTRLRPKATLYVHLHESALDGTTGRAGVARIEGHGPLDITHLAALLRRHDLTVQPVIDNRETHAVDAYEHPTWMRERIFLRSPAEAFPHATRRGRTMDLDHPIPWVDPAHGGPPGQTTTDSQPLSRTTHRARTHLGWTIAPTPAGTVWTSPHGLTRLLDTRGRTHHLTGDEATLLTQGQTDSDHAIDAVLRRLVEESSRES
ncbi:procyclic acidic repetitive family protein [uncultured Nocardioides sp.]|uniref:procyclic acidic repetitive family protein n=1 Tax=uncultured Nocardioides sp. TaxID=198441 RepID=UPI0026365FA9|nr:procyclic acidic repetitive family protein [uncultured Nocardioides sp.]